VRISEVTSSRGANGSAIDSVCREQREGQEPIRSFLTRTRRNFFTGIDRMMSSSTSSQRTKSTSLNWTKQIQTSILIELILPSSISRAQCLTRFRSYRPIVRHESP
jgi:hypothetical protein